MTGVFLDTVGLLATWDMRDQWHGAAERVYVQLLRDKRPMLTTTAVLLECGNAAARKPYRSAVETLRCELERGGFLVPVTDDDWRLAWRACARGAADTAGIVDHISFAVTRRLGIHHAFTNDQHFRAAGFETLF